MVQQPDPNNMDNFNRHLITNQVDESIFVEAGAGSGKTFQLVSRIITLVIERGVPISRIVAITFTESAAAELVTRLRRNFAEIAQTGQLDIKHASARTFSDVEQAKQRASEALEALPGAAIETLHSFCMRILKIFPLEAGLPPRVEKSNDLLADVASAERISDTLALLSASMQGHAETTKLVDALPVPVSGADLRGALECLTAHEVRVNQLGNVVGWMDAHWGELDQTLIEPIHPGGHLTVDYLRGMLQRVEELAGLCTNPADKLFMNVVAPLHGELLRHLEDGAHPERFVEPRMDFRGGAAKHWNGMSPQQVKDTIRDELHNLEIKRLGPVHRALTQVRAVLAARTVELAQQRCRTGMIEFHDMIYLAQRLVRKPEIAQALHERFHTICVDEFQDTDPAQLEILEHIARGAGQHPSPGKLFLVGDPKQSIYRFRNADLDTYMHARENFPSYGEQGHSVVHLANNFRSAPAVVDGVNLMFGELFAQAAHTAEKSEQAPSAVDYVPMEYPDSSGDRPGQVLILRNEEAVEAIGTMGSDSSPHREIEMADIASLIKATMANEFGEYLKDAPGGTAPLELEDIAILVPTHTIARRVIDLLITEGIPYVSEGSTQLFNAPEINELLTVLRAIADPADKFTQVAALRSAILGCSDRELAQYHQLDDPPADHPVSQAKTWLQQQHLRTRKVPLHVFMAELVQSSAVREALASDHSQRANLPRVSLLLQITEEFVASTGLGLREFVHWAEQQAASSQGVAEPVLDNGTKGVRVMTIHRSKGREFPMVIMAGMAHHKSHQVPAQGLDKQSQVLEFKLGSFTTAGYEAMYEYEKLAAQFEAIRLLYVAATRARNTLAIPLELALKSKGKASTKFYGAMLYDAIQNIPHHLPMVSADKLPGGSQTLAKDTQAPQELDFDQAQRHVANLQEHLARAAQQAPRISVTAIAHAEEVAEPEAEQVTSATLATGARLRALLANGHDGHTKIHGNTELKTAGGTAFGSAVHEVMELLPEGENAQALAEAIAPIHDLDAQAITDVVSAVECFAASEPYQQSLRSQKAYRELPVFDRIDDVAVEGIIDVLYLDENDEWVIADYKTDRVATPETISSYFLQLEVYARIVEKAKGIRVARCELIFLGHNGPQVRVERR
ncbi:UvrD-helicase domain-containing protein [Corynebacterium pelargi]|uniref:DNA 3'-5' helicase n=1 Tax=Corynebacterium pelargi TaxID=1471400 RepID=A0A410W840_9CORY|nr:UvrD-helicase domain-containing protein [Corynebacterium pelargi]QAU52125.1 ATP-dependent helicase/nuclease subunit A [Corynebacterium pelargi]GGG69968.1 ATP-dependent helicase/nuclease subunit A [Corynebacterium pelargi]